MTEFDLYAFADYSGSKSEYQQRKAIALSVNDRPREWAKAVNDLICNRLDLPKGPFWGPNFKDQQKNPEFPFKSWNMKEKRLVEERISKII